MATEFGGWHSMTHPQQRPRVWQSVLATLHAGLMGPIATAATQIAPSSGGDVTLANEKLGLVMSAFGFLSTGFLLITGVPHRLIPPIMGGAFTGVATIAMGPQTGMLIGFLAFGNQKLGMLFVERFEPRPRRLGVVTGVPAGVRCLARLADVVAGHRWAGGYTEWLADLADLAGDPDGRPTRRLAQLRHALGLVIAALAMRLGDCRRWAGRGLDWVLARQERILIITVMTVSAAAVIIIIDSGKLTAVLTNADNLAAIGVGVWSLASLLHRGRRPTGGRQAATKPSRAPSPAAPTGSPPCGHRRRKRRKRPRNRR